MLWKNGPSHDQLPPEPQTNQFVLYTGFSLLFVWELIRFVIEPKATTTTTLPRASDDGIEFASAETPQQYDPEHHTGNNVEMAIMFFVEVLPLASLALWMIYQVALSLCCVSHALYGRIMRIEDQEIQEKLQRLVRTVESLPMKTYKEEKKEHSRCVRRNDTCCCICMEDYQEGDRLRELPQCYHEIHSDCLEKWVCSFATKQHQDPSCPLCKQAF